MSLGLKCAGHSCAVETGEGAILPARDRLSFRLRDLGRQLHARRLCALLQLRGKASLLPLRCDGLGRSYGEQGADFAEGTELGGGAEHGECGVAGRQALWMEYQADVIGECPLSRGSDQAGQEGVVAWRCRCSEKWEARRRDVCEILRRRRASRAGRQRQWQCGRATALVVAAGRLFTSRRPGCRGAEHGLELERTQAEPMTGRRRPMATRSGSARHGVAVRLGCLGPALQAQPAAGGSRGSRACGWAVFCCGCLGDQQRNSRLGRLCCGLHPRTSKHGCCPPPHKLAHHRHLFSPPLRSINTPLLPLPSRPSSPRSLLRTVVA